MLIVELLCRRDQLAESLIEHFPHEAEGIRAYLAQAEIPNYLMYAKLIPDSFPFAGPLRSWLWQQLRKSQPEVSAATRVAQFVQDPKLRALLSGGQLIDWNLAPNRVSHLVAEGMLAYYRAGTQSLAISFAGILQRYLYDFAASMANRWFVPGRFVKQHSRGHYPSNRASWGKGYV